MPERGDFFREQAFRLSVSGLYLEASRESFRNPAWENSSFRILIQRLSPFRDVKLSTPHLFLFRAVSQALPGAYIDFSFFPGFRDREILNAGGMPYMHGIASMRDGADFDLILVSNAFTLELLNLPVLLRDSGFPLFSSERAGDEENTGRIYPLILLGGSNALASQAIVAENLDSFVDGIFFGEGEEGIGPLVRMLAERGNEGRKVLERSARSVTGFWPAGSRETVRKAIARKPSASIEGLPYPLLDSEEASTARLEIAKGCPSFCSFCFEGWERKPYRETSLADLLETGKALKAGTGAETLELFAYNFNTHKDIVPILLGLNNVFRRVNAMSQRTDILADSAGLVGFEIASGKRSFTLGIEGISARIRSLYQKELGMEQIRRALAKLLRERIRELKLFYILHGAETQADISEFIEFLKELKTLKGGANPALRIVFSFGYLVRMPFTPFRHEKLILDEAAWRSIEVPVKSAVETHGFEYRLAMSFSEYFAAQVLAMGGHGLAVILALSAAKGFVYDQSLSSEARSFLESEMRARGFLGPEFLGEKGEDYPFAFPFLETGIGNSFIYRRYLEMKKKRPAVFSCRGTECGGCGACEGEEERAFLAGHRTLSASEADIQRMKALIAGKEAIEPIYLNVEVPRTAYGAGGEFLSSWFMRSFAEKEPALFEKLLSAREALFTQKTWSSRIPAFWGNTVFALCFLGEGNFREQLSARGFIVLEALPDALSPELEIEFPPEADIGRAFASFLGERRIQFTLSKNGSHSSYEISVKGKKKHELHSAKIDTREGVKRLSISCGEKIDLRLLFDPRKGGTDFRRASIRVSWSR